MDPLNSIPEAFHMVKPSGECIPQSKWISLTLTAIAQPVTCPVVLVMYIMRLVLDMTVPAVQKL